MNKIQVHVLQQPNDAEHMSSFLARMTQRGHSLATLDDVLSLYNAPVDEALIKNLSAMHHGTIKRFDSYTVIVVGASRRFLAQIRTHQHADFVSGSLQYSDWSNVDDISNMFVVPYAYMQDSQLRTKYLQQCLASYNTYKELATVDNDAAGFIMPNGLRNILVIQANVQEWQYMIKLRTCKRNSAETRYTMLSIWDALLCDTSNGELFFSPEFLGADCQFGGCKEGHFCCCMPYGAKYTPFEIIKKDYPLCLED